MRGRGTMSGFDQLKEKDLHEVKSPYVRSKSTMSYITKIVLISVVGGGVFNLIYNAVVNPADRVAINVTTPGAFSFIIIGAALVGIDKWKDKRRIVYIQSDQAFTSPLSPVQKNPLYQGGGQLYAVCMKCGHTTTGTKHNTWQRCEACGSTGEESYHVITTDRECAIDLVAQASGMDRDEAERITSESM